MSNANSPNSFHAFVVRVIVLVPLLQLDYAGPQDLTTQSDPPAVRLGTISVDPLLSASGLDSAALRRDILALLRERRLIANERSDEPPTLDVRIAAARPVFGPAQPDMFAVVEVGRNLIEQGKSKSLVWQRSVPSRTYGSWEEVARGAHEGVLNLVRAFARYDTEQRS